MKRAPAVAWAAALALFVWLAFDVPRGETWFDEPFRTWVHAHAMPAATTLMIWFSRIGQPLVLVIAAAIICLVLWRVGHSRTATEFAIVIAGAEFIDLGVKNAVRRIRPMPFYGRRPMTYSFPSGHALMSCAFFGCLAVIAAARFKSRAHRWICYSAAILCAGAIGLSRIYLGVHYPSDVLGGYAAAVVWAGTVAFVFHQLRTAPHT